MSIVNTQVNEYGEPITITNPNQTITNIQNITFDSANFRLQGLEVRNFEEYSASETFQSKIYPSRTAIATQGQLTWFGGSNFYIGPFSMVQAERILVECSFGFETVRTGGTPATSTARIAKYQFSIGYADNDQGLNIQVIDGTLRRYQSNLQSLHRVAGSCTIVVAFPYLSADPIYFYLLVQDLNDPGSQLDTPTQLRIYESTLLGRKYKK
tara:strand:+ start:1335 stop:1967 length:633 start_codon:yes stop_codon:yes gene_type:complete